MKKVIIGFLVFLGLLLVTAALVPVLFKDKIKQALDKEIAKNIDAQVLYETDDVSVSIFRNFPNLSLAVDNLSIIGKDSFQTDTLAYIPSFKMGLNLMSVMGGDELKVNSITLDEPVIRLIVLESGKANWDIFLEDTTLTDVDTTASDFKMAINKWEVNSGTLYYDDLSMPMSMDAYNVNHTGQGDFAKDVFDMVSSTKAERFNLVYDGVKYLQNAVLDADVTMSMDLEQYLYTFQDNNIRINSLPFRFDGSILMPEETIAMDLTFKATDADFKSVLSVVPGMYSDKFEDIKTDGKLSFDGYIKGRLNDTLNPGFGTELQVVDAMFKYPDMPQAAQNINVHLRVDNPDGDMAKTVVDVKQMHMEFGKNPIDAKVLIKGIEPMYVDGNVKANVNLQELTNVFPIEGTTLRGLLKVDAKAKGTYSDKKMPVIDADMVLRNGYVKSKDFPEPVEQLNMTANILNKTGNTDDTRIDIQSFKMSLAGEPLTGRALVVGLDQPAFDFKVDGVLDLTKLTKIFPIENTTLAGVIKANVAAKGKMSDIEAEKYTNVQANGVVAVDNLKYVSTDMPNGMRIDKANATFSNDKIQIQNMRGYLGKSDFQATGSVTNYLGYALADNQDLRGTFNLSSNRFDVNEWMVDEEGEETDNPTEGVVEVPDNLDVTLNIDAKQVLYTDLKLNNVSGQVQVKDKVAKLNKVTFNTLGGTFTTSGSYNTKDLQKPLFDMSLDIQNLGFKEAFNAFNTVKAFAPIAQVLEGKFSTKFSFAGELGQDMMPIFQTLDGTGIITVLKAAIKNVPLVDRISNLTNLKELRNFVIENRYIDAQIVDGKLVVKPFDLSVGNIDMSVGGSTSSDGVLDYITALNVPTGKIGKEVNNKLANFLGKESVAGSDRVTLKLSIAGTYSDPKVAIAGGSVKEKATDFVKEAVENKLDVAKKQVEVRKQQLQDSINAELNRRKLEAEQKALQEIQKKRSEAEQQIKKQAADKISDFLRPKTKPAPKPQPAKADTANTGSNQ